MLDEATAHVSRGHYLHVHSELAIYVRTVLFGHRGTWGKNQAWAEWN